MQKQENNISRFSVRQLLILALLFMMAGTLTELYLLDHYEGTLQLIPIIGIGFSLLIMILLFFRKTKILIRLFQLLMVISALSGVYGSFLHLRANFEFEQEMKPTAEIGDLLLESLSGALPSLAPLSLIVLALIGYSYTILIKQNS